MAIRIVRLGSPREMNEEFRIGTVRRPPRGVRKEDYATKNIYDLRFPNLNQYKAFFRVEKDYIDPENTYIWDVKTE
jgi:uncharacterized protein YeaO (DUF488 family)